ncbi:MAG: VWA domain-containing protein [Candidatus Omnitrophica bacterium]|nr:VWA domain-containing protein [Candidatus Omnitrophota bacterium]
MIFEDPFNFLWLFAFAVPIIYLYLKHKANGQVTFSSLSQLKRIKPSAILKLRHVLIGLRLVAVFLMIMALMRPQKGIEETKVETEGIDIILSIDVSGSMLAEDFILNGERKNRLEVVKDVVRDFIKKRTNDRIGLVIFAGRSYVQCPLTLDYGVLLQFLERAEIGMIEDGTAVGDGLAAALTRLRKVDSKSKVVILLTDGVNNAGKVDPLNAAELARATGVRVYTIGAGSKGQVPFPARDFFGNKVYQWAVIDVDDETMTKIAETTGGRYFRATDTESLRKIYDEIDRLEKTKVELNAYMEYKELFQPFVILALMIILAEAALRHTRLRTLP